MDEALGEQTAEAGQTPTPKEMGRVMTRVQAKIQASGLGAEGRVVSEAVTARLAG